jgi:hypothetical protein
MAALPQKADIAECDRHFRFVLLCCWAEELILPYDNLRADVDATIEVDHVIVDKAEATG